ncbi:MAG: MATE family efflux transporter [Clostridiales bacterium]|nr:MATE family efflux transporter [Clostridiales bacterium]
MKIQLSDNFTYRKLLRFCLGPILMMIFTSIYSVVDGIFVSNFAGETPFVAINLIFPVIMILGAFGFMFGAGGTAIVSKTLGEGDNKRANEYFTLVVIVTFVLGVVLAVGFFFALRPIAIVIGAKGEVLTDAVTYSSILLCSMPFFMLQNLFQSFFITAEKPNLGFIFTVASGVTNMVLDALFIAVFKWGVVGAAVATALAQVVGGVLPIVYFARKNNSLLRFVKTKFYGKAILKSCFNGSSELLGNIAMSLVSMIYNWQLLKIVGEEGVAAFGVMMYVQFVFIAIFIGYCLGVAPIVGYNFGAQNKLELQNVFKKSLLIITVIGIVMCVFGVSLAGPIAWIFVRDNSALMDMTERGMRLYSICFLFSGYCMFCSSFFTALNNGLISAIVSFGRTLVFQIVCIFVLPLWLNLDGVWLATPVAEFMSVILCLIMFIVNNRRYGYAPHPHRR